MQLEPRRSSCIAHQRVTSPDVHLAELRCFLQLHYPHPIYRSANCRAQGKLRSHSPRTDCDQGFSPFLHKIASIGRPQNGTRHNTKR